MELDLSEAVEAGRAASDWWLGEGVGDAPWGDEPAPRDPIEAAVRAAAPIIERAVRERLGGICGDPAPTLVLVDDETQSGAGVICELHHGHPSEWHEAPPGPEYGFLPPMRWRNTSISLASLGDFDSPPSIGRTGASETGGETDG